MEVHQSAPHSDLPEKAPGPDYAAYKYSMPESPPESYDTGVWYPPPANPQSAPAGGHQDPSNGGRRWTRWPLLLLYGLILAVIAGLIGGFVGKAIESNNHTTSAALAGSDACPTTPTTASNPSAAPSASASPTSISPAASASASATPASSVFERVIPQPSSGCDASAPYRSFKSRSSILGVPFTTICGQGWMRDDMVAMSVATQSDCIETCSTMNSYVGDGGRKCVGAGFIPEWWDQARAMRESGITPYNCFLKSNTSGIARNNEKFEVIALCMGTNCDGMTG
jgi:hypothetical protein